MENQNLFFKVARNIIKQTSFLWSDKLYLKIMFRLCVGYKFNIKNPKTFNEKLNYLKLHGHNNYYTKLADKYESKKEISKIIGEEYIVPCIGVWESVNDIDFDKLPNKFVLKTTHDSGSVIVCKDRNSFDISDSRHILQKSLCKNYYPKLREWVYKNIKPRIIADAYLDDNTGSELRDYKFWCFNGQPKYVYITIKGKNVFENFYDMDFKPVEINHGFQRHIPEFNRPKQFEQMVSLAKKISMNIPFLRVDFFLVSSRIYFGECTFYDWGGLKPFDKYETDLMLGNLINLKC